MRQITIEAVRAFVNGDKYNKSNTSVEVLQCQASLFLHGNRIAIINDTRGLSNKPIHTLTISSCGWETNTTKERLNGILDYYNLGVIRQKNFNWFLHKPSGEVVPFDSVMTFNI